MTPRGTPAEASRGRQRIRVRRLRPADVPALARLYFETVHAVNARDYAPRQLWAWAPRVYPDAFWRARLCRYRVFVVELGGEPVAFGELDARGEVDCFYTRHTWELGFTPRIFPGHTTSY